MNLVLTTVADPDTGKKIARALVEERLAACVTILPGATSVYRWKGSIEETSEVLLLVKIRAEDRAAVEKRLGEIHPYDVPEILSISPEAVSGSYAAWLHQETAR